MPRGGKRNRTRGKTYTNRSDLNAQTQPVTAVPSRGYGDRATQEAAQGALPLPQTGQVGQAGTPQDTHVRPGEVTGLDAPTQRPSEPLSTGAPFGPGGGPEVLGPANFDEGTEALKALFQAHPESPELAALVEEAGL